MNQSQWLSRSTKNVTLTSVLAGLLLVAVHAACTAGCIAQTVVPAEESKRDVGDAWPHACRHNSDPPPDGDSLLSGDSETDYDPWSDGDPLLSGDSETDYDPWSDGDPLLSGDSETDSDPWSDYDPWSDDDSGSDGGGSDWDGIWL